MSGYSFGNPEPLFGPVPNSAYFHLATRENFTVLKKVQEMCTETLFVGKSQESVICSTPRTTSWAGSVEWSTNLLLRYPDTRGPVTLGR